MPRWSRHDPDGTCSGRSTRSRQCCRRCLSRHSGHIVGVSSLAAYRGFPRHHAYCASKSALNAFLEGLRAEISDRGVRVHDRLPGFVRTPMTVKNTGAMPFLLEPQDAARRILRAVRAGPPRLQLPLADGRADGLGAACSRAAFSTRAVRIAPSRSSDRRTRLPVISLSDYSRPR